MSRQTESNLSTGNLKAMVTVVEEDRQTNMTSVERVESFLEDNSNFDATMLDSIPEFIREDIDEDRRKPQLDVKPMLPTVASIEVLNRSSEVGSTPLTSTRTERTTSGDSTPETPPDELEALWPGVHQEFIPSAKRNPSFYLMMGFMAGAVVSLLGVWGYSAVASKVIASGDSKQILVAGAATKAAAPAPEQELETKSTDPNATLIPISSTYEVKANDTLVVIAMKNYKKVTPRLLDEIVKANGMKSANVLSLGQKLTLPNYKPQSSAIAASSSGQVH